jgi:hypothetical protein
MTVDPATVAAFVDGELNDLTARRIEKEAETDTELAADIARHRMLKAQLNAHYAPVLDESLPERLRTLIVPRTKVDTSLAARRAGRSTRFSTLHWGAVAASLLLGLTIGIQPWMPAPHVAVGHGSLIAAGSLAKALDTQLASDQSGGAAVRIGRSFADRTGRFCRSFESQMLSGIGCREGNRWRLERTMREYARGDYRQASSGELATAAATMMTGKPLDAGAERAARDAGWVRGR